MASYTGICNIWSYDPTSNLLHEKLSALPTERELQTYCTVLAPYLNEISTISVVIHQWSVYKQHATYKYRFEIYSFVNKMSPT